jgi:hypothetical protein
MLSAAELPLWKSSDDLAALSISVCRGAIGHSGLLDITLKTANGLLSPKSITPSINTIARGVIRIMFWKQCKVGVASLVLLGCIAGTTIMLVRGTFAASLSTGTPSQARDRGPASSNDAGTPASRPEPLLELTAADRQDRVSGQIGTSKRRQGDDSSDDVTLDNAPPVVVKTSPEAGASDVDPTLSEIRVTFSKKMLDKSWSWSTASKNTFFRPLRQFQGPGSSPRCAVPAGLRDQTLSDSRPGPALVYRPFPLGSAAASLARCLASLNPRWKR